MSNTKIFLHVGANKTGTTHLQHFLHKNAAVLRKEGLVYPVLSSCFPSNPESHWPLFVRFLDSPLDYYMFTKYSSTLEQKKRCIDSALRIFNDAMVNAPTLLLSAECICRFNSNEIESVKTFLEAHGTLQKVIYYYRSPSRSYFWSAFQQAVKAGRTPAVDGIVNKMKKYNQIFNLLRVFGDKFQLLEYSRIKLVNNDIVDDYFCNLNLNRLDISSTQPKNQAWKPAAVALMYLSITEPMITTQEKYLLMRYLNRSKKFFEKFPHADVRKEQSLIDRLIPTNEWILSALSKDSMIAKLAMKSFHNAQPIDLDGLDRMHQSLVEPCLKSPITHRKIRQTMLQLAEPYRVKYEEEASNFLGRTFVLPRA